MVKSLFVEAIIDFEHDNCRKCGTNLFYKLKGSGQHILPVGLFDDGDKFVFDHQVLSLDSCVLVCGNIGPSFHGDKTDALTDLSITRNLIRPHRFCVKKYRGL